MRNSLKEYLRNSVTHIYINMIFLPRNVTKVLGIKQADHYFAPIACVYNTS